MKRRNIGFTLVELLVAMTVTIFVAVLALSLSSDITEKLTRSSERLQTEAAARFALDKITHDLEALAVLPPPLEWFQSVPSLVSSANFAAPRADELMFYTTALDRPRSSLDDGQISQVYYGLAYKPLQNGKEAFFGLYRAVAEAEAGFQQALGNTNLAALWKDGGAFSGVATARGNLLVQNVVDFRATMNFRHGDGTFESREAPVRLGAKWLASSTTLSATRLVSIEIHLTLLGKRGEEARKMGILSRDEILRRYGTTYSRLIPITAAPSAGDL